MQIGSLHRPVRYHVRAVAEQYGVPVILHTERGEGRWGRWGAEALATGREELGRAQFPCGPSL